MNQAAQPWWKSAVIYQVYPRSFMDANGDGMGDLPGVISKLDYLAGLGIDAIWLSPVFRSPQDDNGYDVSDYQDIDPLFGTLEDMDRLIAEAKKRGIRIILDMVLNHSSDEHRWFIEAKKSRDNPYHDCYIWRDGEAGTPPNDMPASFGGPAWEWVPELKQYYFHQYSVKQPDLNWENPAMRRELYKILRWWAERGVGGFRLDVVDHFGKDPDQKIRVAGPRLHDYIRELSREALQGTELVTVGEAWSATPDSAKLYSNPDGSELSMVFQFEHIKLDRVPGRENRELMPLPFLQFKEVLSRWQTELYGKGWNSLFWENHDLPRCVSRWGNDGEYREVCAKMLAILLFGMQGTPYIYQRHDKCGLCAGRLPRYRGAQPHPGDARGGVQREGDPALAPYRQPRQCQNAHAVEHGGKRGLYKGKAVAEGQSQLPRYQRRGTGKRSGFGLRLLSGADFPAKKISGFCRWPLCIAPAGAQGALCLHPDKRG